MPPTHLRPRMHPTVRRFPGWRLTGSIQGRTRWCVKSCPYQLSTDEARIDRVKQRVAYYRLAFGQARQEDLISVVEAAGVTEGQAEQWRVDLRP